MITIREFVNESEVDVETALEIGKLNLKMYFEKQFNKKVDMNKKFLQLTKSGYEVTGSATDGRIRVKYNNKDVIIFRLSVGKGNKGASKKGITAEILDSGEMIKVNKL